MIEAIGRSEIVNKFRELLSSYQFPGDDVPVIRGAAIKALNGEKGPLADEAIIKLYEALDTFNQAEAAWVRLSGPTRELLQRVWDRYFDERETAPVMGQLDLEDLLHAPLGAPVNVKTAETAPAPRRRVRKMRLN